MAGAFEFDFVRIRERAGEILRLSDELGLPLSRIGRFASGSGLSLTEAGASVPLPERLGYLHG